MVFGLISRFGTDTPRNLGDSPNSKNLNGQMFALISPFRFFLLTKRTVASTSNFRVESRSKMSRTVVFVVWTLRKFEIKAGFVYKWTFSRQQNIIRGRSIFIFEKAKISNFFLLTRVAKPPRYQNMPNSRLAGDLKAETCLQSIFEECKIDGLENPKVV